MSRYIDADKAIAAIRAVPEGNWSGERYVQEIMKVPIADVLANIHGEWIDCTEDGYVECPICHSATNCDGNKEELHFCFSCGAEMRGQTNGRDNS